MTSEMLSLNKRATSRPIESPKIAECSSSSLLRPRERIRRILEETTRTTMHRAIRSHHFVMDIFPKVEARVFRCQDLEPRPTAGRCAPDVCSLQTARETQSLGPLRTLPSGRTSKRSCDSREVDWSCCLPLYRAPNWNPISMIDGSWVCLHESGCYRSHPCQPHSPSMSPSPTRPPPRAAHPIVTQLAGVRWPTKGSPGWRAHAQN
jgi:hypothetical protein